MTNTKGVSRWSVNLNTSSLLHHVEAHQGVECDHRVVEFDTPSGVECDHRGVEFDTPSGVECDHREVEFNAPSGVECDHREVEFDTLGVEFDTFHPSLRSDPPFGL